MKNLNKILEEIKKGVGTERYNKWKSGAFKDYVEKKDTSQTYNIHYVSRYIISRYVDYLKDGEHERIERAKKYLREEELEI